MHQVRSVGQQQHYKSVSPSAVRASEHPTAIVCAADAGSSSVGLTSWELSAQTYFLRTHDNVERDKVTRLGNSLSNVVS